MKKVLLVMMLAVFSLTGFAQNQEGYSSIGLNVGYGFDSENVTIGIDYRYSLTDAVRLAPSLSYYLKKNDLGAFVIDLNAHYVFPLSEMFGFYPLAGLNLSFWNWDNGVSSFSRSRFGANIGLGGEVYATEQITIGLEMKYSLIKDFDQAMLAVRAAYNF